MINFFSVADIRNVSALINIYFIEMSYIHDCQNYSTYLALICLKIAKIVT